MRSFTTWMTTFCRTLSDVPSNSRPARMYVIFGAGVGVGVGLLGCWARALARKKQRIAIRCIPGLGSLCEGDSIGNQAFFDSRKHYHRSPQMTPLPILRFKALKNRAVFVRISAGTRPECGKTAATSASD